MEAKKFKTITHDNVENDDNTVSDVDLSYSEARDDVSDNDSEEELLVDVGSPANLGPFRTFEKAEAEIQIFLK